MKPSIKNPLIAAASIVFCLSQAAHATTYTWTNNSVATQTWTTTANWNSSTVFVDGTGNELKFFADTTTALANGTNAITSSVPATLTMGTLTLNGKSPTTSGQTATINIASNASTWTLGGATPTVNLNGLNSTGALAYDVKANLTLGATTTFTGSGSARFTFSGAIGESASGYGITKSGTSTLTLSGNNNYSGITTINAGKLVVSHNNALGTTAGGTTVNGVAATSGFGNTVTLSSGITVTDETLTLSTASGTRSSLTTPGIATWDGNINLSGSAGIAAFVSDANNTAATTSLTIGSSASDTVTGSGASLMLRGVGANATGTVNSTLNLGAGYIWKVDSATWTINSTNNDYTGVTVIAYGILSFGSITDSGLNSSIGKADRIELGQGNTGGQSSGTLQFTGVSGGSTNRLIRIMNGTNSATNGEGVIENTVAGQTLTLAGNVDTNSTTVATSLTLKGAGNGELSGSIINSPNLALIKSGTGTWTLSGTNTHTGTTTLGTGPSGDPVVDDGVIRLTNSSAIGTGTLVVNGGYQAGRVELSGGSVNLTNAIELQGRQGPTYAAISNYSGNNTISGAINLISNGTSMNIESQAGLLTISGADFTGASGRILTLLGAGNGSFEKNVLTANWASVRKYGNGTWTLTGANTYTGSTTFGAGTISVSSIGDGGVASGNLGSATAAASNLVFDGGTLQYTGNTATSDRAFTINSGKTATIEVSTSGQSLSLAGATGAATTGALAKTGAGTLELTGASTYPGGTTVNDGKLLVNGSTAASAITVAAGSVTGTPKATLGGIGTIGGTVSLTAESTAGFKNGGVLAPTAAASGTKLTVTGTTTFGTGSIFEWNMAANTPSSDPGIVSNSGSYGQLAGTGTIGGSNAVFKILLGAGNAFTDAFWNTNKTWNNLFTGLGASGSLTSIFSSISGAGITYASGQGTVAGQGYFTFNGTSTLNWTAVPEPTSALAGLLITAGLLRRRR